MGQEAGKRYIFAIFILALAVRLAYAVITPPFQAPDEYAHYSYVKFLHDSGHLPVQSSTALRAEELQFHQPPLYYALVAPLFPSTKLIEGRPALPLRSANILFAMLTLWVAYRLASTLWPLNPFMVALTCACVAFVPTFSYISSTIRNGVLATFLASLGFHLFANAVTERGEDHFRWGAIGLIGGLALLSKLTAMGFILAAGLTMLIISRSWRTAVHRAAWFSAGVVSVAGWWFVRNRLVYGQWLTIVETGFESTHTDLDFLAHIKMMMIVLFKTFWAVFGRINEIHFQDIYKFCWAFAGLAVLGFIRYIVQRREDLPKELTTCFLFAIATSLTLTLYYAYNYDSDQGRYMFPVLIPITTFIAVGFNALFPPRYHRMVLDAVLFAFVGINALVLSRLASIYG